MAHFDEWKSIIEVGLGRLFDAWAPLPDFGVIMLGLERTL